MKVYPVTASGGHLVGWFKVPDRLPQEGDVYEAREVFGTAAFVIYHMGDRFAIMGRTTQAPHGRVSGLGNLLILCKAGTSVWAEFDHMVAVGRVVLVRPNVDENRLREVTEMLDQIKMRKPQTA